MNSDFRIERDSMGEMQVPARAWYGAQTARAVENFPISNLRFSRAFIRALGFRHGLRAGARIAGAIGLATYTAMVSYQFMKQDLL